MFLVCFLPTSDFCKRKREREKDREKRDRERQRGVCEAVETWVSSSPRMGGQGQVRRGKQLSLSYKPHR